MRLREFDFLTRLLQTRTLTLASAFFVVGCITAYMTDAPRALCAVAAALCLLAALILFRSKRLLATALIVASLLPLGALRFSSAWQHTRPLPDAKHAELTGRIAAVPEWKADTERTVCLLTDVCVNGTPVRARLRLYLRGEDAAALHAVALGQTVRCDAHVWQADRATNPGQFDFSNYLRVRGLCGYATADIATAEFGTPELRLWDLPERIRAALSAWIDRMFPNNAPIAKAFLLGDRSELTEDVRSAYASAGVMHLLAISGMHISVLAWALNLILARFFNRRAAFGISTALLTLYGLLIGFPASLTRALIMFAVSGGAPLAGRYSDGLTRLCAAMLVYLCIRPEAILDAGFVLSFGACAGIVLLMPPLTALFHAESLLTRKTGKGFKNLLRRGLPKFVVSSLLVTFSAQLAILPAVVSYFGTQPLFSFLANIVLAPLAMLFYGFSILAALSGLAPLCRLSDAAYGFLTGLTRVFAALPLSSLRIAAFPAALTLLCVLICPAASGMSRLKLSIRRFLPLAIFLAALTSNVCARLEAAGTDILFMDAGQADCCILRTRGSVYLVDTGDDYSPAADYLAAKNYAVKGVFLSHLHADHAGGLKDILDICAPETIYLTHDCFDYEIDDGILELIERAEALGSAVVHLNAGDEVSLSDEACVRVLSPREGFSVDTANNDSMVLLFEYGDFRDLFTGDAAGANLEDVACDVDVLKVPHHGSNDSLTEALLAATSPSACVIPVGYNSYGHPTRKTLDRLGLSGAAVYRTDRTGMIRCVPHADGSFEMTTYLDYSAEADYDD